MNPVWIILFTVVATMLAMFGISHIAVKRADAPKAADAPIDVPSDAPKAETRLDQLKRAVSGWKRAGALYALGALLLYGAFLIFTNTSPTETGVDGNPKGIAGKFFRAIAGLGIVFAAYAGSSQMRHFLFPYPGLGLRELCVEAAKGNVGAAIVAAALIVFQALFGNAFVTAFAFQ